MQRLALPGTRLGDNMRWKLRSTNDVFTKMNRRGAFSYAENIVVTINKFVYICDSLQQKDTLGHC